MKRRKKRIILRSWNLFCIGRETSYKLWYHLQIWVVPNSTIQNRLTR